MLTETTLEDNVMQARVIESETPTTAIERFAHSLKQDGFELFAYSICSVDCATRPRCLYSTLPINLFERMIDGAGSRHCIFLRKAAKTGELYEAKQAAKEEFSERLTDAQKLSIEAIGCQEIGVVPKICGDKAHVAFVGLGHKKLNMVEKQFLTTMIGKFGAEHAQEFADAPGLQSEVHASYKKLSRLEAKFVRELVAGKSRYHIAQSMSLSEITVSHIQTSVFNKLQVDSCHKLILRVHELGIIGADRFVSCDGSGALQ